MIYDYFVDDDKPWGVAVDDNISEYYSLKQDAEKNARKTAKRLKPSKLVVYRKDNEMSYMQRYGS